MSEGFGGREIPDRKLFTVEFQLNADATTEFRTDLMGDGVSRLRLDANPKMDSVSKLKRLIDDAAKEKETRVIQMVRIVSSERDRYDFVRSLRLFIANKPQTPEDVQPHLAMSHVRPSDFQGNIVIMKMNEEILPGCSIRLDSPRRPKEQLSIMVAVSLR